MKKYAITLAVITLVLSVGFLLNKTTPIQADPYACHQDSDCVEATFSHQACCSGGCESEIIHKKEAADRLQWVRSHCSEESMMHCTKFDCDNSRRPLPACVKNHCQ